MKIDKIVRTYSDQKNLPISIGIKANRKLLLEHDSFELKN